MLPEQLRCKCCGDLILDSTLLERLNLTEKILASDLTVLSGYRCKKHNSETPGAVNDSSHIYGRAADLQCTNSGYRYALVNALHDAGFKRIGIAQNFIHADVDTTKPQNVIFLY